MSAAVRAIQRGARCDEVCAAPTRRPYRSSTSELDVPGTGLKPRELAAILRDIKQQLRERLCPSALEVAQTFILIRCNHDHGWFAVFGDSLWLAPCRFDDFAEPVLGVLNRP